MTTATENIEGDISAMNLSYEPESEVESDVESVHEKEQESDDEPLGLKKTAAPLPEAVSMPTETIQAMPPQPATVPENASHAAASTAPPLPAGSTPVDGFQLVQATGLTDTSTPSPKGSSIPSFATATPIPDIPMPVRAPLGAPLPPIPAPAPAASNPLSDESKSKQFTARTDYMIAEFFSRQVARLTKGAPEALDRSYRVFQQRFKERLGAQWAHITSQPEVEEAIKRVQDMYDYFEQLEKLVTRQKDGIAKVNDAETELALWYRKEGISEPDGPIRENMLYLSQSYHQVCAERSLLVSAYEQYAEFLKTFKKKAIGDALETMKKQHSARLELDAYGSKLGQLEEKKLKEGASLEKELTACRTRFQEAKNTYQNYSTSLIDKAGLLDLKKGVDFAAHIQKIRQGKASSLMLVHDSFNRGRVGSVDVPEEDQLDEHGLPIVRPPVQ
ncbi:hypothetical protein HDU91_002516 [Kappamyces sp. JEL0680]|nr:hypothetical protein HDU91_002516 [Kappamyces sp. JEL0680]